MGETGHNDIFRELAAASLHHELNEEESKQFSKELEDPGNQKIFQEMKKTDEKIRQLKILQRVSPTRSWERTTRHFHRKKIKLVANISKYAAIIVLTFAIGSLINVGQFFHDEPQKLTTVSVPLGQMSQIELPDGTNIWLNSGTTLTYGNNFGSQSRNVELQGEAFFKVKPEKIPFKIKIKNTEVEVLGTSFNVVSYAEDNFSQVTLVEGKVKINNSEGEEITRLKPSEQIFIPDNLSEIKIKNVDTGFYVSWTDGKIVFDEERLADIAEKLKRWYNVEIRFSDEQAGNYRFSGTILKNKPFDQIIKAFELLLPVKISYTNNLEKKDSVLISKK